MPSVEKPGSLLGNISPSTSTGGNVTVPTPPGVCQSDQAPPQNILFTDTPATFNDYFTQDDVT